jgi:hypothetical protein
VTVELWFRNTLDPERIEGDLTTLVNNLNIAAANGKQFTILDGTMGPVMVQTVNIVKAREVSDDNAFIGR